jgi:Zn-dependent peptidase ImmA (M78 family)/predicted secreted protein
VIDHRAVQVQAMKTALDAHRVLRTDLTRQVDIYSAIATFGVTLAFVPLTNLSGAYVPGLPETDGRPGIVINSRHPRSRQRFSAGHELCHHLRDQDVFWDSSTELLGRGQQPIDEREATAEAFAAWFLMPPQLVRHNWRQLEIHQHVGPEAVYRLSLALGTSYLATASHLYTLKLISRQARRALAEVPPKWIKSQLAVHGPGDSWGDVWRITEQDGDRPSITPRPGDEIVIDLPELPSSGYVWSVVNRTPKLPVEDSSFEPQAPSDDDDSLYGGWGRRRIVMRVVEPGRLGVELAMQRPWERNQSPARFLALDVNVEDRVEGYAPLAEAV